MKVTLYKSKYIRTSFCCKNLYQVYVSWMVLWSGVGMEYVDLALYRNVIVWECCCCIGVLLYRRVVVFGTRFSARNGIMAVQVTATNIGSEVI